MERALVWGAAARRVGGRPTEPAPPSALPGAAAAAAGRTGSGGRDLRGAGLLLRGGLGGGGAGACATFGGLASSDATSRSKASAAGGVTEGVGLRRLGLDSGRLERGDSSE